MWRKPEGNSRWISYLFDDSHRMCECHLCCRSTVKKTGCHPRSSNYSFVITLSLIHAFCRGISDDVDSISNPDDNAKYSTHSMIHFSEFYLSARRILFVELSARESIMIVIRCICFQL